MTTKKIDVDLEDLRKMLVNLRVVRSRVQNAIDYAGKLPALVDNAQINSFDNNSAKPGQQDQMTNVSRTGGEFITKVGPSRFGLYPNGLALALRHAKAFNGVMAGLLTARDKLDTLISSTSFIIDNYDKVEDYTIAQFKQALTAEHHDGTLGAPVETSGTAPKGQRYGTRSAVAE